MISRLRMLLPSMALNLVCSMIYDAGPRPGRVWVYVTHYLPGTPENNAKHQMQPTLLA